MKRCPKCNRTYTTSTQKFCTHDGGVLELVDAGQETIRIDSPQFDTDAPTKAISRELKPEAASDFDPFKTIMTRPGDTTSTGGRETQNISPGSTPLPPTAPPPLEEDMMRTMASIPPPPKPPSTPLPASPPSVRDPEETVQQRVPTLPPPPPATPTPPVGAPHQPTQRLVGTGPIAQSAPLPSAPLTQPQTQPSPPPPSVAKKSKLPLILGILVVLLVLVAGLGVAAYLLGPKIISTIQAKRVSPDPSPAPTTTPIAETTPSEGPKATPVPEPRPYSPPADAVPFVNAKENLDGKLAEHYVEFSFYYPNRWEKDPNAGVPGASNFAKVERRLPPTFTQENFAVGWYSSAGSADADRAVFPSLAQKLSAQFEKNFPEYREVSKGETRAGAYQGYEFRFQAISRNTEKGDIKLWGRLIFLPPVDGGKNGVTLLMLATSLAPELKSVDDVGVKGELPMMLESFRFGKK